MMQDYIRTSTYQRAMLSNVVDFHDKVGECNTFCCLLNEIQFDKISILLCFADGLTRSSQQVLLVTSIAISVFLCPQLQRSWRGILLLGCLSVCPSVCHAF